MIDASVLVLVVSLTDATDRRHRTAVQLGRLGLPFEFIDAVDGRAEMPAGSSRLGTLLEIGRTMTGTEVGCALSHAAAYRRLVDSPAGVGLILEDDVDIDPRLIDLVTAIDQLPPGWDIVTLFHGMRTQLAGPTQPVATEVAVRRLLHSFGTVGYILNHEAAAQLVERTDPVRLPADELLFRPGVSSLRTYATIPPLVRDGAFDSLIRGSDPSGLSRPLYGRVLSRLYRSTRTLARRGSATIDDADKTTDRP